MLAAWPYRPELISTGYRLVVLIRQDRWFWFGNIQELSRISVMDSTFMGLALDAALTMRSDHPVGFVCDNPVGWLGWRNGSGGGVHGWAVGENCLYDRTG